MTRPTKCKHCGHPTSAYGVNDICEECSAGDYLLCKTCAQRFSTVSGLKAHCFVDHHEPVRRGWSEVTP